MLESLLLEGPVVVGFVFQLILDVFDGALFTFNDVVSSDTV
jgi:hypothetical protein